MENLNEIKRLEQFDTVIHNEDGTETVTEFNVTIKEIFVLPIVNKHYVLVEEALNTIPRKVVDGVAYDYIGIDRIDFLKQYDRFNFLLPYRETLHGTRQTLEVTNHEALYNEFISRYEKDNRVAKYGVKSYKQMRKREIMQWLTEHDYIINKIVLGEWQDTNERYLSYKEQRALYRAELDELGI